MIPNWATKVWKNRLSNNTNLIKQMICWDNWGKSLFSSRWRNLSKKLRNNIYWKMSYLCKILTSSLLTNKSLCNSFIHALRCNVLRYWQRTTYGANYLSSYLMLVSSQNFINKLSHVTRHWVIWKNTSWNWMKTHVFSVTNQNISLY